MRREHEICIHLQIHIAANVKEGTAAQSFQSDEPYHFAVDWCWYLSALVPAYCAAWYLMHTLVKMVEHQFFTSRQVLYFVIGIRVRRCTLRRRSLAPIFVAQCICSSV